MAFRFSQDVLFKHCDPAGIVFFPRYFEMMNDCVEAFFARVVGVPWHALHRTGGVPTAEIATRFTAPSRHGDALTLTLTITHVGRTSCRYRMTAHCADDLRFDTTATLVHVGATGRPEPWTDPIRQTLMTEKDTTP